MYEKLLALLTSKFSQARKDGLQQLARSLALQVSDDTESQALVDKLQDSQVTEFIKDWRKEVDSEVSKGTKSFEENLKNKYDLVEKKQPSKKGDGKTDDDLESIVARAIAEAVTPLQEKIKSFESGKTLESRKDLLLKKLNNTPEVFKNRVLKNFEKMSFNDDEDFNSFVAETEADGKTIEQELANKGLGNFPHPSSSSSAKKNGEAVAADIAGWAKSKKDN